MGSDAEQFGQPRVGDTGPFAAAHRTRLTATVPDTRALDQPLDLLSAGRVTVDVGYLRAGLVAGVSVRRCEEQPSQSAPSPENQQSAKASSPRPGVGHWQQWPWALLDLVPGATRATWDKPPVIIWHDKLD